MQVDDNRMVQRKTLGILLLCAGSVAYRDVLLVHGRLAASVSRGTGHGDPLRGLRRKAERDHQQRLQISGHL